MAQCSGGWGEEMDATAEGRACYGKPGCNGQTEQEGARELARAQQLFPQRWGEDTERKKAEISEEHM